MRRRTPHGGDDGSSRDHRRTALADENLGEIRWPVYEMTSSAVAALAADTRVVDTANKPETWCRQHTHHCNGPPSAFASVAPHGGRALRTPFRTLRCRLRRRSLLGKYANSEPTVPRRVCSFPPTRPHPGRLRAVALLGPRVAADRRNMPKARSSSMPTVTSGAQQCGAQLYEQRWWSWV
jgi:hypothetical protein